MNFEKKREIFDRLANLSNEQSIRIIELLGILSERQLRKLEDKSKMDLDTRNKVCEVLAFSGMNALIQALVCTVSSIMETFGDGELSHNEVIAMSKEVAYVLGQRLSRSFPDLIDPAANYQERN